MLANGNATCAPSMAMDRDPSGALGDPRAPFYFLRALRSLRPRRHADPMSDPTPTDPRDEALQELALSEARYRALAEGSSDFIYVLDPEGRFSFANPELGRLLGYSPDEMDVRHFSTSAHGLYRGGNRVKNNLQIISSLLHLQAIRIEDDDLDLENPTTLGLRAG